MVLAHNYEEFERTSDIKISVDVTFESMLLQNKTLTGLKNCGFFKPSPIQLHGIPLGKCGFDLFLEAKSGTGKTAVFTVVALEKIDLNKGLQSVILAPTREIASQISDVIKQIGSSYEGLNVAVVMGGLPIEEDIAKFSKNVHILVGSPGRMRHLFHNKYVDITGVRLLVLDEADKLMDKSFQADINYIFSILPQSKQVIMSSATYPKELKTIMQNYVLKAQHICPDTTSVLLGIKQLVTTVKCNVNIVRQTQNKFEELLKILTKREFKQCLIFCNYQVRVGELCKMLTREKWPAEQLHGQLEQTDRLDALKTLQEYKCRILVSTDLAARGIDASNVDVVINFEPPSEWQTYLHRIGRAGRFGSYGVAITILSEGKEESKFKAMIKHINSSINLNYLWDDNIFECNEHNKDCTSQETDETNIQPEEVQQDSKRQETEQLSQESDKINHKTDKVENDITSPNEGLVCKAEVEPVVLTEKPKDLKKSESHKYGSFNELMALFEVYVNINNNDESAETLQTKEGQVKNCEALFDTSNNEELPNIAATSGLEKLFDTFGPDRDFKIESFGELIKSLEQYESKDIENKNIYEDLSYGKYFDFNNRPELILMLESEEEGNLQEKIIETDENTGENYLDRNKVTKTLNSYEIEEGTFQSSGNRFKQDETIISNVNSFEVLNNDKEIVNTQSINSSFEMSVELKHHKIRNEYIGIDNNSSKALEEAGLPTSFTSKKYNNNKINESKQLKSKNKSDKCRKNNNYSRNEQTSNEIFGKKSLKSSNKVMPDNNDDEDDYKTQSYFHRPSKHARPQNIDEQHCHYNRNTVDDIDSCNKIHKNDAINCDIARKYNAWYKQLKTHIKHVEMCLYVEELSETY